MNDLQHARSLVVLGCPTPRMDGGLLQQLAAFYLGEPVLDAGWDMTPERYLTPGDQGHWEVEVRRYNDARVDSAFRSRRESELFQVVHRARPLIRSGRLNIVIVTEQPIPGLPVHLTGVGHVYCPELDDVTAQVFEGARVAMRLAQAKGREAITTGDIAEAAGMSRSRTFRRKVRDRARELYYHLGLEARKAIRGRALRNGGRGSYEEFEFTWIESGSRPPP